MNYSTTSNYKPASNDPSNSESTEEAFASQVTEGEDVLSSQHHSLALQDSEYEELEILEDVENMPEYSNTPSSSTPVSKPGTKRKRKLNTSDYAVETNADALKNKMHEVMDIVGDVASSMQSQQSNRHKDYCSYLGQRMSMLPMKIARNLEVEFATRVNELIDIHSDQ